MKMPPFTHEQSSAFFHRAADCIDTLKHLLKHDQSRSIQYAFSPFAEHEEVFFHGLLHLVTEYFAVFHGERYTVSGEPGMINLTW